MDFNVTDLALHQPENNEENYPLTKLSLITDHKGMSFCSHGEGEEGGRADPLEADPLVLTSSGGHCSGRYTSYWYGFLFHRVFEKGQGQGQSLLAEVLDLP